MCQKYVIESIETTCVEILSLSERFLSLNSAFTLGSFFMIWLNDYTFADCYDTPLSNFVLLPTDSFEHSTVLDFSSTVCDNRSNLVYVIVSRV